MAKNPFKTLMKKNEEELDQGLKNEFDQNQSKPHFGTRDAQDIPKKPVVHRP